MQAFMAVTGNILPCSQRAATGPYPKGIHVPMITFQIIYFSLFYFYLLGTLLLRTLYSHWLFSRHKCNRDVSLVD
jgi:hypothetical protein